MIRVLSCHATRTYDFQLIPIHILKLRLELKELQEKTYEQKCTTEADSDGKIIDAHIQILISLPDVTWHNFIFTKLLSVNIKNLKLVLYPDAIFRSKISRLKTNYISKSNDMMQNWPIMTKFT